MNRWIWSGVLATSACAGSAPPAATPAPSPLSPAPAVAAAPAPAASKVDSLSVDRAQYPSTYSRKPFAPVLIEHATILTAAGTELTNGSILFADGKVVQVASGSIPAPAGAKVVDGTGKFVTPGIIDSHSHLGVYAAPGTQAESDGNEATNPNTAEVWAEHSFWPQDPQIPLAIAGGITVAQILPGSANLIGGRSVTVRMLPGRSVQEIKYPGAPYGVKMACGENPKRVYQSRGPSTRMGNMAGYRTAFIQAEQYRQRWDRWLANNRQGEAPARDLRLETLADVLRGKILVHNHCYRADEMVEMLDLAREFGFKIRSFHHVVEGYKIADKLAAAGTAASVWADWWGFKMESFDGIPENAALIAQAGARTIIHSDSPDGIQHLNQEAGKAFYAGLRAGITVTRDQAIKWITLNPAWALGIDSTTGSLEPGKAADVVVWSADPFSIYAKAEQVYNDGALVFDRHDARYQPQTDFNLGQAKPGVGR